MENDFNKRFTILAPQKGYVSYLIDQFRNQKPKVGDWIISGIPFLKLSTSQKLVGELYVPEKWLGRLKLGNTLAAETMDNNQKLELIISKINPYPQRIGTVLEYAAKAPYANEKVFVVKANLKNEVPFIPGSKIKVYLPKVKI